MVPLPCAERKSRCPATDVRPGNKREHTLERTREVVAASQLNGDSDTRVAGYSEVAILVFEPGSE